MPALPISVILPDKRKRAWAFLLDLTVVSCICQWLIFSYFLFMHQYLKFIPAETYWDFVAHFRIIKIPLLLFTYISYSFFCLYLGGGQTLGKFCFKMRVVDYYDEARALSWDQALLRSLGHGLCYIFQFFPLLVAYFHPKQRGIPDFLSCTRVLPVGAVCEKASHKQRKDFTSQLDLFKRKA